MNPEQSDTVEAIESSLRLMNATGSSTSSDSIGAQEQLGAASLPDTAHTRRSLPQQESRDSGMPPSEAGATAQASELPSTSGARPLATSTSDYTVCGHAGSSHSPTATESASAHAQPSALRAVPRHQRLRQSKSWPDGDVASVNRAGRPTTLALDMERADARDTHSDAIASSASDDDDVSEWLNASLKRAPRDADSPSRDFLFSIPVNTSRTASGEFSRSTAVSDMPPLSSASSSSTNSPESGTSRDAHVAYVTAQLSQVFVTDPQQSAPQYTCTCSAHESAAALPQCTSTNTHEQPLSTVSEDVEQHDARAPEQTVNDASQTCERCLHRNRSAPVEAVESRRYFRSVSCPSRPLATLGRASASVSSRVTGAIPAPPNVTSAGARSTTKASYSERCVVEI